MTDVVEIAKKRRATLAAEIVMLDEFLRMSDALVNSSQDADGGPFALDEGSAIGAGFPQADDDSSEAALVFVHVGQRIRHRRWMMGISQDQLGELLGAKVETIQQFETGSSRISANHMREIAAAMDIPVSFFVEGLDEQIPDTDTARRDTLQD